MVNAMRNARKIRLPPARSMPSMGTVLASRNELSRRRYARTPPLPVTFGTYAFTAPPVLGTTPAGVAVPPSRHDGDGRARTRRQCTSNDACPAGWHARATALPVVGRPRPRADAARRRAAAPRRLRRDTARLRAGGRTDDRAVARLGQPARPPARARTRLRRQHGRLGAHGLPGDRRRARPVARCGGEQPARRAVRRGLLAVRASRPDPRALVRAVPLLPHARAAPPRMRAHPARSELSR